MIPIIGLLVLSCADRDITRESTRMQFFDIAQLIDSLPASRSLNVLKTIMVDGVQEEKLLAGYDFHRDIEGFENYTINKPALYDKYEVDSIMDDGGVLSTLVYTGLDEDLKVQKMEVTYDGSSPRSISLKLKTDSFLEDIEMDIQWNINTDYQVVKREKRIFGKEHQHEIRVTVQS